MNERPIRCPNCFGAGGCMATPCALCFGNGKVPPAVVASVNQVAADLEAGSQSLTGLFSHAHLEAMAAFSRPEIDISVTRDTDEDEDRRYIARAVHNETLAIAHGPTPEEALDALVRRIRTIAWGNDLVAKTDKAFAEKWERIGPEGFRKEEEVRRERLRSPEDRDMRAQMPTLSPEAKR